jgi:hypothetical protein
MKKNKIAFVLPEDLYNEMRQKIIADGYGLRGKSLWVEEAIEQLLKAHNYIELVDINDEMRGFSKAETIIVPVDMKFKLENALIKVRQAYPAMNGVQSRIVRTAIIQRLLGFAN